jgi:predicted metal-dependent HD superfamily phosphohydrolase
MTKPAVCFIIFNILAQRMVTEMINSPEGIFIVQKLQNELPEHFYYHNLNHTLDVYRCAESIAQQENINCADKNLLLVAALYHDAGYLLQINDHETASCNIVRENLVRYGYSPKEIEQVCALIMATRIPQTPTSLFEKIICDADLDYLGRDDFFTTGNNLYCELLAIGQINNEEEWDQLQTLFLQQHKFFTATSLKNRQPKQQENLAALQINHQP